MLFVSTSLSSQVNNLIEEPATCRRESFNENCLRAVKEEVKERRRSFNEGIVCEDVCSPFVSMPTIPAVYLIGDADSQPLEKVSSLEHETKRIRNRFVFSSAKWIWTTRTTFVH